MNNTKLVIPSCNDFMSIYGFDCEMDDVIQILKFVHGDERVSLSFDITVNCFTEVILLYLIFIERIY